MSTSLRKLLLIASIAVGIVCLCESAWIQVKARIAQALIAGTWHRAQAGRGAQPPWPWADTRALVRVTLSSAGGSTVWIVLDGASGRNLAFGPVHDAASVPPGEPGNSVIEGHRDTHFAALRSVRLGDRLHVERLGGSPVDFVVTDRRVVDSRRVRITLGHERPRLTLVTCYPFDAVVPGGPLRWVVTADATAT